MRFNTLHEPACYSNGMTKAQTNGPQSDTGRLPSPRKNYSTSECKCYAVLRTVLFLKPYIEAIDLTGRTDHISLQHMTTLSDPHGRHMRWRLRLMKFDFEILYRPGLVHQVPDALSRLEKPRTAFNDAVEIDKEISSSEDFPTRSLSRQSACPEKGVLAPVMILASIDSCRQATVRTIARRQRNTNQESAAPPVDASAPIANAPDPRSTILVNPST